MFRLIFILFLVGIEAQQQGNVTHTTTTPSEARYRLAATSSGELVFFGGGFNSTGQPSNRVDIYNVTSESWTTSALSQSRRYLVATSSQNLVFFGGGVYGTSTYSNRVDIYNTLTGSWSTATLSQPRYFLAATSVGNLVLFGGGQNSTNGSSNVVDVFDVTSNTWTTATLSQARRYLAATSVDNRYALFGGGYNGSDPSDVVDIFDSLSGMWNTATLIQPRYYLSATSHGNLAFFGGGQTGSGASKVVDIFNSTSQTWNTTTLSQARYLLSASSIGEIVAFGGGWTGSTTSSVVDMLNVTSNSWFTINLSQPRYEFASTSSTNKIFFGGGKGSNSEYFDVVDIFCFGVNCTLSTPQSPPPPTATTTTPPPTASPLSSPFIPSSLTTTSTNLPSSLPSPVMSPLSSTTTQQPISNPSDSPQPTNSTGLVDEANSLPTEAIVGIAVGAAGLVLGVALILLIFFIKRRRKPKSKQEQKETKDHSQPSEEQGETKDNSPMVSQQDSAYVALTQISNQQNESITQNQSQTLPSSLTLSLQPQVSLSHSQIEFKEIIVENKIGVGSYGKVCLGKWNGTPVALKFCRKKGRLEDFIQEVKTMIKLPPHPNVVQMFGVSIDGPQPVIVMEYCAGGSLDKLLFDSNEKLSEDHKIRLIRGIAAGMLHLHKHNIVHRDLAARNILLTESGQPKISDFGMSRILERTDEGKTNTAVGPVCWMAPESIGHRNYSKKSDVWTFGIVVYEIVAQCEPHKDKDVLEVAMRIRDEGLTPEIPSDCPQKLRELMQMCWKKDPNERPTFESICPMLQ